MNSAQFLLKIDRKLIKINSNGLLWQYANKIKKVKVGWVWGTVNNYKWFLIKPSNDLNFKAGLILSVQLTKLKTRTPRYWTWRKITQYIIHIKPPTPEPKFWTFNQQTLWAKSRDACQESSYRRDTVEVCQHTIRASVWPAPPPKQRKRELQSAVVQLRLPSCWNPCWLLKEPAGWLNPPPVLLPIGKKFCWGAPPRCCWGIWLNCPKFCMPCCCCMGIMFGMPPICMPPWGKFMAPPLCCIPLGCIPYCWYWGTCCG